MYVMVICTIKLLSYFLSMERYIYNRDTITVKTDSVYIPSLLNNKFHYDPKRTEKRAMALSILLGGYNPLREKTTIELDTLKDLQQQLENLIYQVEKTIQ